jgi:membrane protein implicated in regulation of membrane protease activity
MEPWHIWIIVALVFFIMEIFTPGFAVACLSIGSIGGSIASACGLEFKFQILVFAIATLLAFVLVRPVVLKVFHNKSKEVLTNVDALVGRQAIVSEEIVPIVGGRVKVDGDDWKAISADGRPVSAGTPVRILKVESVILTVEII